MRLIPPSRNDKVVSFVVIDETNGDVQVGLIIKKGQNSYQFSQYEDVWLDPDELEQLAKLMREKE